MSIRWENLVYIFCAHRELVVDIFPKMCNNVIVKRKQRERSLTMKRIFALVLSLAVLTATFTSCSVVDKIFDREIPSYRDNYREQMKTPPAIEVMTGANVDSLDKLNYYGAMCILAGTPMPVAALTAYGEDTPEKPTEGFDTDSGSEAPTDTPESNEKPDPDRDIYYYAIDPDEPFIFNNVSMFQIELTDEDGFLASKLGLGIVDVVISEDCIWGDSLITFRNGENFYSCLSNGKGYDRKAGTTIFEFSTHKFVDGYYIVKNIEQENYSFSITLEMDGQAIAFECAESENGGNRVDKDVKIASYTVISTTGGTFTAKELEEYFKREEPKEKPEVEEMV